MVRAGDGRTVGEILARAGEGQAAIGEGRVFVGKRRVSRGEQPVREGETVRIGAKRRSAGPTPEVTILFQRDGLVACVKPAGLPTVPDLDGAAHSLVAVVGQKLGIDPSGLRVTSRLDHGVSGVVVFATDEEAERRLQDARNRGGYHRRYLALGVATVADAAGAGPRGMLWDAAIGRAADPRLRKVDGLDAKAARTTARRIATADRLVLLAVDPETGRTHQIRIHASHANLPLLGDRDYGGPTSLTLGNGRILAFDPPRIGLHAARVIVPGRGGDPIEVTAPLPEALLDLWRDAGGDPAAWVEAVASPAWRPDEAVE